MKPRPFAIAGALRIVRQAVGRVSEDTEDPFETLVSCLISLRTKDEVTDVAATRLLAAASSPQRLSRLKPERIAALIYPAGFYRRKGVVLRDMARLLCSRWGGRVPDTMEDLLSIKGVGRKTANLVLSVGHGLPAICVDIHVHRITNRWGYVRTRDPDETEQALRGKLPGRYWRIINWLLVQYGKTVCTPLSPKCSLRAIRPMCAQAGVTKTR